MTCEAGFLLHILVFLDLCYKHYFSADTLELVKSVWGWVLAINIVLNGRIPSVNGRKVR